MKTRFSLVLGALALLLVGPTLAQNLQLKTGQTIKTQGVRRTGDMVMGAVQVGSSRGEVGYQAVTIARIDFPEPPQPKTTGDLLSQGTSAEGRAGAGPGGALEGGSRQLRPHTGTRPSARRTAGWPVRATGVESSLVQVLLVGLKSSVPLGCPELKPWPPTTRMLPS